MNDILSNAWETDASNPKELDPDAIKMEGRVKVSRSSVITIPNSTLTSVAWNNEIYDIGSMWSVGDSTNFIIPVDGDYLVIAYVTFVANATGQRSISVVTTALTDETITVNQDATAAGVCGVQISSVLSLTAADKIHINVLQDSGGGLNISADLSGCFVSKLFGPDSV